MAHADTLDMPAAPVAAPAPVTATPGKGETMQAVEHQFGAPTQKYPAVGGDSPKHPPITRWDYPGFSVFFEHSHVVTTVVPGHPPEIYRTDRLSSAQ
jgi:hypothetical protein